VRSEPLSGQTTLGLVGTQTEEWGVPGFPPQGGDQGWWGKRKQKKGKKYDNVTRKVSLKRRKRTNISKKGVPKKSGKLGIGAEKRKEVRNQS